MSDAYQQYLDEKTRSKQEQHAKAALETTTRQYGSPTACGFYESLRIINKQRFVKTEETLG